MNPRFKYPRTMHHPWSLGVASDDKVIQTLDFLEGEEVVITEKYDGECTTIARDYTHARSTDSGYHPSRTWIKKLHSEIGYLIPEDLRICGENLYACHSIFYEDLLSYFYGFSVWRGSRSLAWDPTLEIFEKLGIIPVRTLYRGTFDHEVIIDLIENLDTEHQEGFVIRSTGEIEYDDFSRLVCKWVRKGHVQTDEHWMHSEVKPNLLRKAV